MGTVLATLDIGELACEKCRDTVKRIGIQKSKTHACRICDCESKHEGDCCHRWRRYVAGFQTSQTI